MGGYTYWELGGMPHDSQLAKAQQIQVMVALPVYVVLQAEFVLEFVELATQTGAEATTVATG